MGFEFWKKKPSNVREAAIDGNKASLSAMGKKGAEVANRNRDLKKSSDVRWAEMNKIRKEAEDEEMQKSANEHIINPDGEDQDYKVNL